jgi:cytosine/adenosine deaminase-related metal-dependent hydrolase
MRRLTADWILHPDGNLVPGHTLVLESNGTIAGLERHAADDSEHIEGILCPGFVNAHGHLELSHLNGKITQGNKLTGFISEFITARRENNAGISDAALVACKYMWESGTQGSGDICNTYDSFGAKKNSPVRFYNFVEVFSPVPGQIAKVMEDAGALTDKIRSDRGVCGIVPHAPYSVPPALFRAVKEIAESNESLYCIHNQETQGENEMFKTGNGPLIRLFRSMGIGMEWFEPTGKTSLVSVSDYFPSKGKIMLVHNTYTGIDDLQYLVTSGLFERCWFCLCPKANLFIEGRLPNIPMLMHEGCRIVIGTDSLASNDSISVLEELKTIHHQYRKIPVAQLLQWATANGADFFGWSDLGRFKPGCRPGVIQITQAGAGHLMPGSAVRRMV